MTLVFKKMVSVDGNDAGLVWLGHIRKDGVHHTCHNKTKMVQLLFVYVTDSAMPHCLSDLTF